jgi:hypothetical protein
MEMGQSGPERRVEETEALLRDVVVRLSRDCSPQLLCDAAREELLGLRPHLQKALGALANLDGQRGLSEEERARRHAFRMLLEAAR